jgi:predicted SAM-dependent methyltransferase
MFIREALKKSNTVVGAVRDTRRLFNVVRHSNTIGSNGHIIRHYLRTHDVPKLQIGAGANLLDGWLSTDLEPRRPGVAFLDATKPFPFKDGTFDYVYSEHMIEHIPWSDGSFMLRECMRVLKPGGAIRVATPDLNVLLDLYRGTDSPAAQRYIHWITDRFLDGVRVYKPQFVINNAFHNWGHQFLYDADVLTMALQEAGFSDIRQVRTGESFDPNLRELESHGAYIEDNEMANFETMIFEASKKD